MRLTHIALRHMRRGKARAALVVAGLALGVATAVALANVTEALERNLGDELDRYGANIVVAPRTDDLLVSYGGVSVSGVSYEFERLDTSDLRAIRAIEYAERLAVVAPVLVGTVDAEGRRAAVAGVDFVEAIRLKKWWRVAGHVPSEPDEVLVGSEAARALGILPTASVDASGASGIATQPIAAAGMDQADHSAHAGSHATSEHEAPDWHQSVVLGGQSFRVTGILASTGSADDRLVFVDIARAQDLLGRPDEISLVEVSALCVECPVETMVQQIQDALPQARVTAVQQAVKARSMTIARLARFGAAIAGVVIVVAALLVFVTMTSAVAERRREIGVLRAVGFRRSHILKILGIETVLLGIGGGIAGFALGLAASAAAVRYFTQGAVGGGDIDLALAGTAVGGAVLIGLLGALHPALKAAKVDPTEALRHV